MAQASEGLFALKPVTFRYKKGIDPQGIPQFGLVAEDVEAVNPDLVVRDEEGKVNTVRYDAVNAMLLNEFLKEHRKVEELSSIVAEQRKEINALAAAVKEEAAQVQKVSAQVELSKTGPQMVVNKHSTSSNHICARLVCARCSAPHRCRACASRERAKRYNTMEDYRSARRSLLVRCRMSMLV